MVAVFGGMRMLSTPTACARSRAGLCCGAEVAHCPIAAYDFAPVDAVLAPISSTLTNGWRRPRRQRRSGSNRPTTPTLVPR
ncbi:hypothetical protein M878_44135 [Streptomyces roseochromogenus subsp. oscitans DS 12.976]|uniref:Uncharacterized protein n=1 Tax=Streptomyces roseochromogenus subsp. oscitans DS 12.976 TaxID=1352936 RepID=V6JGS2_STRRC|nr:hypothetical protein M878_44135 [Streptomyces roseochromogenus subsp. oscitans DS 12.976]